MLVTTERPGAARVTERAWDSLGQALPWITPLLLISFVLIVGLDFAIVWLHDALNIPTDKALDAIAESSAGLSVSASLPSLGLNIVADATRAAVFAPVAVTMHRFILLGEIRRFQFLSRLTLQFAAWIFAIDVWGTMIDWALRFDDDMPVPVTVTVFILAIGFCIVAIRMLLLYPAVAVEEKVESLSSRIESALRRGSGIFWLTVGAFVLTYLPIGAVNVLVAYMLDEFSKPSSLMQVWLNLSNAVAVALGAAIASHLYSYAAHRDTTAALS